MGERLTLDQYRALAVKEHARGPALLLQQIRYGNLPPPALEYRFDPKRRWRFDFAWPEALVAAEYEGIYGKVSRHTTVTGFRADCEKYNAAAAAGWRVFRFVAGHVTSGEAFQLLEAALVVRIAGK